MGKFLLIFSNLKLPICHLGMQVLLTNLYDLKNFIEVQQPHHWLVLGSIKRSFTSAASSVNELSRSCEDSASTNLSVQMHYISQNISLEDV